MLLAVLSDTHGRAPEAAAALRLLNERNPAAFLHCGDVGDRRRSPDAVLDEFARAAAGRPAHVVPGNNDPDRAALRTACEDRGLIYGDPAVFTLSGARVCGTHGTRGEQATLAADGLNGEPFALVCSGHTHRRAWEVRDYATHRTALLNPGACWRAAVRGAAAVNLTNPEALTCEFLDVPRVG